MANCRIRYLATSIMVDFQPGCANFSYWIYQKIADPRWKQTGEGIRLGCEVTEAEAVYIENIARCQWGPDGCEVIGRPAPACKPEPSPEVKLKPRKAKGVDELQLSLF